MKNVKWIALACVVVVSGCAGAQLKSEWKEKRGYSDADVQAIMDQYQEYNKLTASASVSSNVFNSAPVTEARSRLHSIFCACAKKLHDKCREKPDGLSPEDKKLWIKANAADMAMVGRSTTFERSTASVVDPDECGN